MLKKSFPLISLYVCTVDEDAADEINKSFEIEGTNLRITIKRDKK